MNKYLNNTDNPARHTGKMLTEYFASKRIRKSALARKMNRLPATISAYQKKSSLQTAILWELCFALNHNFFSDIAIALPKDFTTTAPPDTTARETIKKLEQEILLLKAEKEVLMCVLKK